MVVLVVAVASHLIVGVEVLDEVPEIERKPGVKVVGLISDTHIPSRAEKLPDKVFEVFKDTDL
ncbi:MAG: hypothetical protein FGF53_08570, partial [Candidatus Brockarchaeota archaeon]|nr:hypothetical protein [Candidatus Brockarchaeota archaeon]